MFCPDVEKSVKLVTNYKKPFSNILFSGDSGAFEYEITLLKAVQSVHAEADPHHKNHYGRLRHYSSRPMPSLRSHGLKNNVVPTVPVCTQLYSRVQ
jgi:hypothetical protein